MFPKLFLCEDVWHCLTIWSLLCFRDLYRIWHEFAWHILQSPRWVVMIWGYLRPLLVIFVVISWQRGVSPALGYGASIHRSMCLEVPFWGPERSCSEDGLRQSREWIGDCGPGSFSVQCHSATEEHVHNLQIKYLQVSTSILIILQCWWKTNFCASVYLGLPSPRVTPIRQCAVNKVLWRATALRSADLGLTYVICHIYLYLWEDSKLMHVDVSIGVQNEYPVSYYFQNQWDIFAAQTVLSTCRSLRVRDSQLRISIV